MKKSDLYLKSKSVTKFENNTEILHMFRSSPTKNKMFRSRRSSHIKVRRLSVPLPFVIQTELLVLCECGENKMES